MTAQPTEDIKKRFSHHPPATEERVAAHEYARAKVLALAADLDATLPPGREHALALTKLEEVLFWANAAIARQ